MQRIPSDDCFGNPIDRQRRIVVNLQARIGRFSRCANLRTAASGVFVNQILQFNVDRVIMKNFHENFACRSLTRSSVIDFAFCLLVSFSLVQFVQSQNLDHPDDIAGLTALFNATGGPTWTSNSGWIDWINQPHLYSICNAFGVTCSLIGQQSRVTMLSLAENQLQGSIPKLISVVSELQGMDLNTNQLFGSLPSSVGNLSALQFLDLSYNQLSGTIPSSLGSIAALQYLLLYNTQLSGSIPSSLGNLTALQYLILSKNQLSGTIPSSLCFSPALQFLYLQKNQLSGTIPSSLGNLTSLQYLELSANKLSGTIPPSLGNLATLESVVLETNQLVGSIPWSLGNLFSLQTLRLGSNQLSGTIPSSLGNLTSLQILNLFGNQLTGSIPWSLGNLLLLKTLFLSSNQLSGTIPSSLGNLASLQSLNLQTNQISGTIPLSFCKLTSLLDIGIGENLLSGTIPSSLSNLSLLRILRLETNQLSGTIPSSFGDFSALDFLSLGTNQLSGTIPSLLGNLSTLTSLYLYENQLSGPIPSSLGNISTLKFLYLYKNQLSGTIPSSLGYFSALKSLRLEVNQLSGTIPSSLGNLTALKVLRLGTNQLSGTIPSSMCNLSFLRTLDLGDNVLAGNDVFRWLPCLHSLSVLDLSSNLFSGNFDVFKQAFVPAFVNLSNNPLGPLFNHFPGSLSASQFSLVDVRSSDQSSGFLCPYPNDYPSTFTILRSPCQPSWTEFGLLCGYGAAGLVVAIGCFLCLRKLFAEHRLKLLVYVGQWFAAAASLILDFFNLRTMMQNLLIKTDHCSPINSYAIFSQFTAYEWIDMSNPLPNTTFSTWNQQFIDFGGVLPTDRSVMANLQAFGDLCATVPECGVDSFRTSCVITHPELASSGQAAFLTFFACLITVIALRCLIELSRLCLVLWSLWICRIKFADYGALFIGRSVFAPFLYFRADTRSEFSDMLIHRKVPLTHHQFLLELIHSALLTSIPLLASSLFYIMVVAQTGVTATNLISIMFTGFNTCVLICRAMYVWITSFIEARVPPHSDGSSLGQEVRPQLTNELLGKIMVKSDDFSAVELAITSNPFFESSASSDETEHASKSVVKPDVVNVESASLTTESDSNAIVTKSDDLDSSASVQRPVSVVSGSDSASSDTLPAPPPSRRRMSSIVISQTLTEEHVEKPIQKLAEESAEELVEKPKPVVAVDSEDSAAIDANESYETAKS